MAKAKPKATRPKTPQKKKAVQVSFDPALLRSLDAQPEAKRIGRSAYVMRAILAYMQKEKARELDEHFTAVYGKPGVADQLYADAQPFFAEQVWPDDDLVEDLPPEQVQRPARAQRGR